MFGLAGVKGVVAAGADADLVVYDPAREHTISAKTHHMDVDYSCYEGRSVQGGSDIVLSRGSVIVRDGKFTGEVTEPILGRAAKLATLIELRESFDLDDIDTLVTGDGANDLGMIENAGLGVAYHAKPAVAAAAAARIDFGDLTALLYAQGYRRDEFVEG